MIHKHLGRRVAPRLVKAAPRVTYSSSGEAAREIRNDLFSRPYVWRGCDPALRARLDAEWEADQEGAA